MNIKTFRPKGRPFGRNMDSQREAVKNLTPDNAGVVRKIVRKVEERAGIRELQNIIIEINGQNRDFINYIEKFLLFKREKKTISSKVISLSPPEVDSLIRVGKLIDRYFPGLKEKGGSIKFLSPSPNSLLIFYGNGHIEYAAPSGEKYKCNLTPGTNGYLLIKKLVEDKAAGMVKSDRRAILDLPFKANNTVSGIPGGKSVVKDLVKYIRTKKLGINSGSGDDPFMVGSGYGLRCSAVFEK